MLIYKGARLKIERANKHITDIELRIDLLKKGLIVSAQVEANTGCEFIHCDFANIKDRDAVDELAVMLGDAIHNLKCSLDHAWLETMARLVPSRNWERTKFPVYPTSNDLECALRSLGVHISAPHFFNLIMRDIRPHAGGDFAIRTVHELDIRDKHRLLIPLVHYSSIGEIYLKDPQGVMHRGNTWGTTIPLPHFVKFERGLHIEDPGSASFDVMFEYGDAGSETRTVDTLRLYSQHILRVVKLFEGFEEPCRD